MAERFKKIITPEILQEHMTQLVSRHRNPYRNGKSGIAMLIGGAGIFIALFGAAEGGSIFALAVLAFTALLVVYLLIPQRPTKPKPVPTEKIRLVLDLVWDKQVVRRGRGDHVYNEHRLVFNTAGPVVVPYSVDEPRIFVESTPDYVSTQVGDKFYVAIYTEEYGPDNPLLLFYPPDEWRVEELTPEELAEELCREDVLMDALIACQRFPKPVLRKACFQESPNAFWVDRGKTEEQLNLLERFAARYFGFDLVGAVEFILRYCPPQLQEAAEAEYTASQLQLKGIVEKYAKQYDGEQARKAALEKVKETFFGD